MQKKKQLSTEGNQDIHLNINTWISSKLRGQRFRENKKKLSTSLENDERCAEDDENSFGDENYSSGEDYDGERHPNNYYSDDGME